MVEVSGNLRIRVEKESQPYLVMVKYYDRSRIGDTNEL